MVNLYLDNFRGFSKVVIPFSQVNFLVGENSTGKSSVLALLNLINSEDFWFSQNFNQTEYEFGGFRDILSANSLREPLFSFGVATKLFDAQVKKEKLYSFLASYSEQDALPSINFFARLHDRQLTSLRRFKKVWKYRETVLPKGYNIKQSDKLFEILQDERDLKECSFKEIPISMHHASPMFVLFSMLEMQIKNGKGDLFELMQPPFPFPPLSRSFAWLAPIRTKPRRTYDGYGSNYSPEGEHTPYLLRKRLRAGPNLVSSFRAALEKFGKESGMFTSVDIHNLSDDATSPFELIVKLLPSLHLRINSVGYGVSQVLPLVVEMLARRKHSWFAIQQPEVHLHPRAQAALGDLIFQMAAVENKRFFIETHSDFTIDRFRLNFRAKSPYKTKAQILFFERSTKGNTITPLPLKENGEYPNKQPDAFRDFFLKEQIQLLGI